MRKISFFVIAAVGLILAGAGGWMALTPTRAVKHDYPLHYGSIPSGRSHYEQPMPLDRREAFGQVSPR
jgi:hypothetical protein